MAESPLDQRVAVVRGAGQGVSSDVTGPVIEAGGGRTR